MNRSTVSLRPNLSRFRPLLWLLMVALLCFSGCGQNPKIDISVRIDNEKIIFDIPHSDINGLLDFRVFDETGNVLWHVDMSYEKGSSITYGELPAGGNLDARQVVPIPESTPPEIWGKRVTVTVEYQYDEFAAASVSSFAKTLQVSGKPAKKE